MELIDYKKNKPVAIWLYICSIAIFLVITIKTIPANINLDLVIVAWLQYLWVFIIGILYSIPFLLFLLANRLPKIYLPSLFGFLLIGCAHWLSKLYLGLDILLFGLLFHMAIKLSIEQARDSAVLAPLYKPIRLSMILLVITLFLGWSNLFTNHIYHQGMAILTGLTILFTVMRSRNFQKSKRIKMVFRILALILLLQISLGGIVSIMPEQYYITMLHRGGSLLLLAGLIWAWHEVPHSNYSIDENDK